MYTLIVDCNGFALEHGIYIVDEGGQTQAIAQLPTTEIASFAVQSQVKKIYLQGPAEYCFGIGESIGRQLITEYSNNNIEIEVM